MWTVYVCLVLSAQTGDAWQKQESISLKNIQQITQDFVRAGEGSMARHEVRIGALADSADATTLAERLRGLGFKEARPTQ